MGFSTFLLVTYSPEKIQRIPKQTVTARCLFYRGLPSKTRKNTPRRGGSLRTRAAVLPLGAVSTLGAELLGREKWWG